MKNKRTKKIIKLGILLFGIAIFVIACEKDNFTEEKTLETLTEELPISIKSISLSEVGETFNTLKNKYQLDNHFGRQQTGNTQHRAADEQENSGIIIYTDNVKEIIQGDYISYTMLIKSLDLDPETFYNITIEEKNDVEGMFVTQYTKASESSISKVSTKRINDLQETIGKEDFGNEDAETIGGGSGGGSGNSVYPTDCDGTVVPTTVAIPILCTCENHAPWQSCDCGNQPYWDYITTYECLGSDSSNPPDNTDPTTGNPDTSGPGGNTGGSDENNTNNPSLTSPVDEDESCQAVVSNLNSNYSLNSPFNVDLEDFYPTNCNTVDTTNVETNEKFMCIYNKLIQSAKFKDLFLDIFGESEVFDVKFTIVDNIVDANGQCAFISGHINETTGQLVDLKLEISLDKGYINGSSAIAVAKTIMHESIHAYLTFKYYSCNQGATLGIMDDVEMTELLSEYYLECAPLQGQHEFMFNFLVPTMSEILSDLKDDLIPQNHQQSAENRQFVNEENPTTDDLGSYVRNVPWNWDVFFKYMSLVGLHESSAFNLELGSYEPVNEQTPKYMNYYDYGVEVGTNSFKKDCDD